MSAVASQGVEIMGDGGHWVTQYSLNYSCDGVKWFQHRFQGANVVSYDVQYLQSSLIGLGGGRDGGGTVDNFL